MLGEPSAHGLPVRGPGGASPKVYPWGRFLFVVTRRRSRRRHTAGKSNRIGPKQRLEPGFSMYD